MDYRIGYLFKVITDKIKINADADMRRHNLTLTQSRVLTFLEKKGGTATQKEIEEFLEVAHPTVVGIVSRMEQNGFVISWTDPDDKRNKLVKLTKRAEMLGRELESVISEHDRKMLAGLTDRQIEELKKSLMVIYENLNEAFGK